MARPADDDFNEALHPTPEEIQEQRETIDQDQKAELVWLVRNLPPDHLRKFMCRGRELLEAQRAAEKRRIN